MGVFQFFHQLIFQVIGYVTYLPCNGVVRRGTVFIVTALVSLIIMDTISIAAGSMSSSAIVCGFLHSAILYATLYDASCALLLTDAAVFKVIFLLAVFNPFSLEEVWCLTDMAGM